MNDIRMFITLNTCDKIVASMNELGFDVLMIEGVLSDNYFIETNKKIKLFDLDTRKYIIINSIYRTSQSSDIELILTDCDKTAKKWLSEYDEYIKEEV